VRTAKDNGQSDTDGRSSAFFVHKQGISESVTNVMIWHYYCTKEVNKDACEALYQR